MPEEARVLVTQRKPLRCCMLLTTSMPTTTDEELAMAVQSVRKFSYAELCHATNNFSSDEVIGQGGFGRVYRGTLPGANRDVAVKRISADSNQGKKEYEAEVIVNGKLSHPNDVQLLGWFHLKD